jgi:hypothetical protein
VAINRNARPATTQSRLNGSDAIPRNGVSKGKRIELGMATLLLSDARLTTSIWIGNALHKSALAARFPRNAGACIGQTIDCGMQLKWLPKNTTTRSVAANILIAAAHDFEEREFSQSSFRPSLNATTAGAASAERGLPRTSAPLITFFLSRQGAPIPRLTFASHTSGAMSGATTEARRNCDCLVDNVEKDHIA